MNQATNRASHRRSKSCVLAIAFIAVASVLHAQTAPGAGGSPSSAAGTNPNESDVVELSPFTVDASEDDGYRANNTLSGSRLNSSLRDTPGAIDVLTADFLADIGVTSLQEALAFSANFAEDHGDFDSQGVINTIFPGSQINVNFRTRGLGGTMARNYLESDSRPAFYTVERIDNSSGPNSILFGLGSAGGVANITTKRARLNRDSFGVSLLLDRNGSQRATVDINQAVIPQKLGLRLNAHANRGKRYRENFEDNTNGVHVAGTWRAGDRTEVRFEYEKERTTGSVAYPGPHITNTYVLNWLDRGSPVYDLPTNWETMNNAARNAIVNPPGTPTAFIFTGGSGGVMPVVVQNGDTAYVMNATTSLFSNSSAGSNNDLNNQTIDPRFFDQRGNINGPGGSKGVNRQVMAVAIDHQFARNLYANLSIAREEGSAFTYQAFANGAASGATILVDANGTLTHSARVANLGTTPLSTNANGQIINPFAGEYYTQSRWLNRTQYSERDTIQATIAWQVDLGRRLGSHHLVGTISYWERTSGSENFRDSWLYAPFNANPTNTNNGVTRRRYASPLDASNFHVPDWRDFPEITWDHPTLGPITSGWVTEGENRRDASQVSYLIATQSRFFNQRLVLTAGYRIDDATDKVYGRKTVKPPGWEASNGLNVLDLDDVTKTTTSGPTRTLGGVFHVLNSDRLALSVFGNKSSNFGPPRGNTVGPDAITPPNTKGEGIDGGLKFELWNRKVFVDLVYFDTASNDVTEVLTMNLNNDDSIRGAYNAVFPILNAPVGASPLFNSNDPNAVAALISSYPLVRPFYNANADMLDQASRGYEARITANPMRGLRIRATFSKTEREREDLYRFTKPMAAQLRTYITDLQAANPSVNMGNLTSATNPEITINNWLDALDERLDTNTDLLSNNFGGGKLNANITATYDFQRVLKGFGTTWSSRYRSGAYTGAYEIREGGIQTGALVKSVPVFGQSTIDHDISIRYRTRLNWFRDATVTIQLNVTNVFNQYDPIIRRIRTEIVAPEAPLPTEFVTRSYFIRQPRSWSLTARLDF